MTALVFEYIRQTRKVFIELVDGLSIDELNAIPEGFRNNIAWNFGHIVVSTLGLCYRRTQVQPDRQIQFVESYTKGTKPEHWIGESEIHTLKSQALNTIDLIEQDYKNGAFATVVPYSTATFGLEMDTIEEVLVMSLAHDNLHFGYATALRKAVQEQNSQLHK
ncbi:DinB family protein [Parapedobacter indicus]|uniref:DinB superfamily protein n=1 Tax=Parapedobacter indicus TaxID=1477437 RepID=A0A1I3H098_9SPHI|nr:DinB family protein [Parapedobacter indicus]PPL02848.1 DinB family protein [Parapedobacter indicus]SFI28992.1 DinB superfamily protein [Parapedobacter indicus]